ncbi:hypothetical protein [Jiella mangrovi]|uniref:Uncharacterized protein n=1 Tax=Jiella mangrovi TaxID=2821407 RepID=A0ABS4BF03_9HYPH|nr:hypothetical protein [Jiella mangrovi]MBP0615327.1 hypothetical protein [Jiella mangrovi]
MKSAKDKGLWLWWQAIFPIGGPVFVPIACLGLWSTGNDAFHIELQTVFAEITPWALLFYSATMIGTALHLWFPKFSQHPMLSSALIADLVAVTIYASFVAIWRHEENYSPPLAVYMVSCVILFVTIFLSYMTWTKS